MAMIGTKLRAGLEGYNRGRDLAYQKEQRGLKREAQELQLDNAKWQSQRNKTVARREDKQYQRADEQYNRRQDGMSAVRNFMMTGDVKALENFTNEYSPEGVNHQITKNEDGTYTTVLDVNGKVTKKTHESEDGFMPYVMMLTQEDPYKEINRQRDIETATNQATLEHLRDMEKLGTEYSYKKSIEMLKQMMKQGKEGRGGWKHLQDISNDMERRANSRRGEETISGRYAFSGLNRDLANYDALIGTQLYDVKGWDTNRAYAKAHNEVNEIYKAAQDAAAKVTDDKDKQVNLVRTFMDQMVVERVKDLSSQRGAGTKRGLRPGERVITDETAEGGQPTKQGDQGAGQEPPKKAIEHLLNNYESNPELKQFFDDKYGKGMADKYIGNTSAPAKQESKPKATDKPQPKSKGLAPPKDETKAQLQNPASGKVKQSDVERHKAKVSVAKTSPRQEKAMNSLISQARNKVDQARRSGKLDDVSTTVLRRALHSEGLDKKATSEIVRILNQREQSTKEGAKKVAEKYGLQINDK